LAIDTRQGDPYGRLMSPRPRHVALATLVLTVATALSGAGVSSAS